MVLSASLFGLALVSFALASVVLSSERARSSRLFASKARARFDAVWVYVMTLVTQTGVVVNRFFVQIWWRYLVHVSLRVLLMGMAGLYDRLVSYFEYNRKTARTLRRDKQQWRRSSHLTAIAEHRQSTALSEAEKASRRRQALND